ncbi:lipopolysaccharide biosynthesis protein [Draconibacterium halophilum]|uniref:Lipopolysaccharide biosynthesis protein n=1 Tax=Draconibacterium halophilum TaxID=2706887 RepID=A0A6C0RD04_9BACT|nr:lipopolysaccharide biosynthesis protein [Draconibacterium halophilum]QIA08518.1 lipopolysaccharide biosynthesis protein [Draconibacterium halophilum]
MNSGLKQKALTGIFWSLVEKFGNQISQVIIGIILARLLTPDDFGLIGMITVFFAVGEIFIEGGFRQAYVQKKEATDIDASTMFYFNFFSSLIFYLLLYTTAPLIASFYNEPQLILIIKVMGLFIIIRSLSIVQEAKLAKNVDFKKRTKIFTSAFIVSGISAVIAAYSNMGVWSLVIQRIINASFVAIALWIFTDKIKLNSFSLTSLKSMFSFGSWILFQTVLGRFFDNLYQIIIGKFYPAAQVGFYTNAKRFENASSENITSAIGSVAFPVFSRFQNDTKKLKKATKQYMENLLFIILPVMIILMIVSKPFIIIFLTEKWLPMLPYLRLLCIVGILYPINAVSSNALWGLGKSKLNFYYSLVTFTLRIINVFLMYPLGVSYIIIGEIVLRIVIFILKGIAMGNLISFGIKEQFLLILKYIVFGLVLIIVGGLLAIQIETQEIEFVVNIFLLSGIYLLLNYFLNKEHLMSFLLNFKSLYK